MGKRRGREREKGRRQQWLTGPRFKTLNDPKGKEKEEEGEAHCMKRKKGKMLDGIL